MTQSDWDRFSHFILLYFILCIYFCLCWVFIAPYRLSLVVAIEGRSPLQCEGFSLWWLLFCRAQTLGHTGSVALQHVASSQARDWTFVSCIGRQILNHWTTREPQLSNFQAFIMEENWIDLFDWYWFDIHNNPLCQNKQNRKVKWQTIYATNFLEDDSYTILWSNYPPIKNKCF